MDINDSISDIFDLVWRVDFSAPGFCLLDLGPGVRSHELRSAMVELKAKLGDIAQHRSWGRLVYRSMGRFDQQVTTKFHLDGAPARSMLMLGYEPSKVRSRLSLADYIRCAFDLGMDPRQFLDELNPMFSKGEESLRGYVTELPQPEVGHSRIVLINNSFMPFTETRTNPIGVMHKAEIISPNDAERRIVNSIMLALDEGSEVQDSAQEHEFLTTDKISPRIYG